MSERVMELAGVGSFLVTTSWYSGIGHVRSDTGRDEYFCELSRMTDPYGEIVIALSSTGDLVEAQEELSSRLARHEYVDYGPESAQDVLYETELGQTNFWHVYGTDLHRHMARITDPTFQYWWVKAIRFPDEEFASEAEERQNYLKVTAFNRAKQDQGSTWAAEDYRKCHTVAARRSARPPERFL